MSSVTKKGYLISLLILTTLLFSTFVSAELLVGQPNSLYNIGDKFEISITIKTQKYTSDFLTSNLVCSGKETEIFKSPYSVDANTEKQVMISTNLDNFLVSGLTGECYIKASYGGSTVTSQKFEISKDITVILNIEGIVFDPGAGVNIKGQATKANGELLDGFIEVSVPEIEFSFVGPVTAGNFNLNFSIPENSPSGMYEIKARVYEKNTLEEIINEGSTTGTIRIKQVIKRLEIATSQQSISPTQDLTYSVLVYDQANEAAGADVSTTIYRPDSTVFEKKIIRSGETNTVALEDTSPPGYWKIESTINDLKTTKEFFVEEYKDLSFNLENGTLTVTNTGNVPYTGPIEVLIGDLTEVKDLKDLAISSYKKFKLAAPDGEYNIKISEGTNKQEIGTTFLTGKAISVQAVGEGLAGSNLKILIGLVVILLVAVGVVLLYRKIAKKRAMLGYSTSKESIKVNTQKSPVKSSSAESPSLIDKGERQESTIISLKIKNLAAVEKTDALGAIDSALWKAKEAGAKIYSDGEYRVVIFAPVLTKEKDTALKAIDIAMGMERMLVAYNRRSAAKISFGIGVNEGMLIVESKEGKFRFMSINNIIGSTKRISEISESEVLISEVLHRKTVGKIKSVKVHDKNLWKIEKVTDRATHSDYVKHMSRGHDSK